MNEKRWIVFIVSLLLLSLSGCCTRAGIRDNGSGAYTVRENLGALSEQQAESAIASEHLNGAIAGARAESEQLNREITASGEQSEHLKQSITDGAGYLEEFADILQQIRARGGRNNSEKTSPN